MIETADIQAQARMTVETEAAIETAPFALPVIPPGQMHFWRHEWRREPGLRALIRAAAALGEERCAKNKTLRGLWEISRSRDWIAEDDGKMPWGGQFAALDRGALPAVKEAGA